MRSKKTDKQILEALQKCWNEGGNMVLDMYDWCDGIQVALAEIKRLEEQNRALRTELATNRKQDTLCQANEQEAKADAGKPRLTLVPQRIIWDIAAVRDFGTKKYKDPNNWKRVSKERYRDAAFRHFMRYLATPHGVDEESGLPHLWHCATNIAFLCELEDDADDGNN